MQSGIRRATSLERRIYDPAEINYVLISSGKHPGKIRRGIGAE